MAIFTGSGVAIVTPFHENGEVNYEMLGELIEFHTKPMRSSFAERQVRLLR